MIKNKKRFNNFIFISRIIFIIFFVFIGLELLILGSYILANSAKYAIARHYNWVFVIYIVFGIILTTAPVLLLKEYNSTVQFIKMLISVLFLIIGIFTLIINSLSMAQDWFDSIDWFQITNLITSCLLILTTPLFVFKITKKIKVNKMSPILVKQEPEPEYKEPFDSFEESIKETM